MAATPYHYPGTIFQHTNSFVFIDMPAFLLISPLFSYTFLFRLRVFKDALCFQ